MKQEQNLRATNHYLFYPDEADIPTYLAYGFRPVFLLLAPYMILSMVLWGLVWSDVISLSFIMDDTLTWHVYEMLFGILTAGAMAFLTTGLPELFPGMVPFVGRRLQQIIYLWIAGRVSFWFMDYLSIYVAAILNLAMLAWIIWFAKDTVLDKLQRHASLGYTLVGLFVVEVWFFAAKLGWVVSDPMAVLKVALGLIVVLILLALRRVNMEAINELMEDKGIDDVYISRPPKTNLAVFSVLVFTVVEYFFPQSSTLGWLSLAVAAAILGVMGDYALDDSFILNQAYVIYLGCIYILLACGYALIGWDLLDDSIYGINHFRHFITSGGVGLSYLVIMIIIGWVHTGRQLHANIYTHLMVGLIVLATVLRGIIPFYEEYSYWLYLFSSLLWAVPFALYMKVFYSFLLTPRADGIKG